MKKSLIILIVLCSMGLVFCWQPTEAQARSKNSFYLHGGYESRDYQEKNRYHPHYRHPHHGHYHSHYYGHQIYHHGQHPRKNRSDFSDYFNKNAGHPYGDRRHRLGLGNLDL